MIERGWKWPRVSTPAWGLLLSLAGCGEERTVPATQVLVSVNSDLDLRTQLSRVEVAVYDWQGQDPAVATHPFSVTADEPLEGQTRVPFSFGIARGQHDRFRLVVRGYAPDAGRKSRLVLQQTVVSSFQKEQTLLLKIFLGSACFEKLCADDGVEATCYPSAGANIAPGECGPIPEVELEPLPKGEDPHAWTRLDAGLEGEPEEDAALDAGLDAGSLDDAERDSEPAAPLSDAARDADAALAEDAAGDTGPSEAGQPEAALPMPKTLSVSIAKDADDVTWVTEADTVAPYAVRTTERFHYRDDVPSGRHLEIGNDEADESIGLRFVLPVPKGASVTSAKLTLQRFPLVSTEFPNAAPESATMRVQVFETANVPPFVASHAHGAIDHAPIWQGAAVTGFRVGATGKDTRSPELKQLVQHVLDRSEWQSGASIGFVLSVDDVAVGQYADFTDYSYDSARAAKLDLTYTTP